MRGASLLPQRSCPTVISDLSLPHHKFLLNSNPAPLHAAVSVIHHPCHLQNPTPRVAMRTTSRFLLPDQFCAHLIIAAFSRRAAPHSQEPCWRPCKTLAAVVMGPVGDCSRVPGSAGCLAGPRSPACLGAVTGQRSHSTDGPARGKPCCHP